MRLHTIKPFLHIFLAQCITTNSFTHLEHQVTWPKSQSKYKTQNPNGSNNYFIATNWNIITMYTGKKLEFITIFLR